jgi:hypothetical protein
MLANLYLHEFDRWVVNELGTEIDLRYVRYADDFVIMLRSPNMFARIGQEVEQKLSSNDFRLELNQEKTKEIDVRKEGLDFVGFSFDGEHIRARQKSLDRFKRRIILEVFRSIPKRITDENSLDRTLNWLIWRINWKIQGMRGKEECPRCRCERIGAPRSWMAFFRVITDREQLRELDKWIRQTIYRHIYAEFGARIDRKTLNAGPRKLKSLVREIHQVRKASTKPCLCDMRERGHKVWNFASDLYQGRSFKTLFQKRPFSVPFVGDDALQVSIRNRQYRISEEVLQDTWDRLLKGETIYRADLEKEGIRNTSQIVALMAELPGVVVGYHPISLTHQENPSAGFLSGMKRTPNSSK